MPVTRAQTSTSREPTVCPTYSQLTGSACASAATTVTSGAGIPPMGPPWPLPPFSLPFEGLQAATTALRRTGQSCLKRMRIPRLSQRERVLTSVSPVMLQL